MKVIPWAVLAAFLLSPGCARVRVEAPKDPIKVDISMRLDIYQHIKNDINDIENMVSGAPGEAKPKNSSSLSDYFIAAAYAQESLGPEVEQAALRRKERKAELAGWQSKGVIGEDRMGLLAIRDRVQSGPALAALINSENSDRMSIYAAVAKKNGASLEDVARLYAKRLQSDAPSGTPVEVADGSGGYAWTKK
jgi:uncharacterized protein